MSWSKAGQNWVMVEVRLGALQAGKTEFVKLLKLGVGRLGWVGILRI